MNFLDKRLYLFAVPGFIAYFSANFVSDMPNVRESQLPFIYFVLSVLSLLPPICVTFLVLRHRKLTVQFRDLMMNVKFVSITFVFSIVIGFGFGVLHTTDVMSAGLRSIFGKDIIPIFSHNELVRELFSRAYSNDFPDGRLEILPAKKFDHSNRYVRISLSGGKKSYEGVVEKFFSGADKPQVYISPACSVVGNNVEVIQGPGVWVNLTNSTDIQFLDGRCSACATKHEELMERVGGQFCPYNSD